MSTEMKENGAAIDPAAVLGAATALWQACQHDPRPDLSASYGDGIQWMREVMRVATLFETWAAQRVCFDEFDECWPYFLEDNFGVACVGLVGADGLASFEEADCLRLALRLRLPVICSNAVPMTCHHEPVKLRRNAGTGAELGSGDRVSRDGGGTLSEIRRQPDFGPPR